MEITDRFRVQDETGAVFEVLEMREQLNTSSLDKRSWTYGLPHYVLRLPSRTPPVNRLDDTTFQLVENGMKLKRLE